MREFQGSDGQRHDQQDLGDDHYLHGLHGDLLYSEILDNGRGQAARPIRVKHGETERDPG